MTDEEQVIRSLQAVLARCRDVPSTIRIVEDWLFGAWLDPELKFEEGSCLSPKVKIEEEETEAKGLISQAGKRPRRRRN